MKRSRNPNPYRFQEPTALLNVVNIETKIIRKVLFIKNEIEIFS